MSSHVITETADDLIQLVTFRLGAEEYAVNVAQVQEIVRLAAITAVPRSPHFVEGVVNLRGRIVPVIDLAKRFDLPVQERTKASRIIITAVEGRTVGMLVDSVSEVLRISLSAIEAAPDVLVGSVNADYIQGIGKLEDRLLILLDLPRIISAQEGEAIGAMALSTASEG